MINFCCVLYGEKYSIDYVQNLYNMVKRHLTVEHKFYAFSDNVRLKKLIDGDIIVKEFPLHDMQGWWNKMQLFHPDNGLSGLNLYMDLDVVILKNIDCFARFSNKSSFNITSDFNGRKIWYNSSLMKWDSETMKPIIWDEFIKKRSHYYRLQGDQNAQFELAGIYYRGLGVDKDLKQAKFWAKLASNGSNPTIASRSREFLKNQMSWWEKQKLGASSLFSIFSGN